MKIDRQSFLHVVGAAVVAPGAAAAESSFHVLSAFDVATLEAFGETLLPGARDAGLARYVDDQLAVPPRESLLLLQYLGQPPPFDSFYRNGLAALDRLSRTAHGMPFAQLDGAARSTSVRDIGAGQPPGWTGPPAPLFYFAVRGDALDVVYGTVAGFEKLGIPYMPHVRPVRRW